MAEPKLTERMTAMVRESERGGFGRADTATGVELRSGADYAVARALERRGLGTVEEGYDGLPGLYFNNDDGLSLRDELLGLPQTEGEDDECPTCGGKGWDHD